MSRHYPHRAVATLRNALVAADTALELKGALLVCPHRTSLLTIQAALRSALEDLGVDELELRQRPLL